MEAELGTPKSFPAATRPLYSGQQVTVAMLVVVGGLTCPGTSIYSESLAPQNKPIRLVLSLLLPHYTVEKTEPQRAGCTTSEEQNWHSNPESVLLAATQQASYSTGSAGSGSEHHAAALSASASTPAKVTGGIFLYSLCSPHPIETSRKSTFPWALVTWFKDKILTEKAGQMRTSLKFKRSPRGITFEVFFCLNTIVSNTINDRTEASQHPISWLWLRKEMEIPNSYGGGLDTPKPRKLEMAWVRLFLEDSEIKSVQISICPSWIHNRHKSISQDHGAPIFSTLQESSI